VVSELSLHRLMAGAPKAIGLWCASILWLVSLACSVGSGAEPVSDANAPIRIRPVASRFSTILVLENHAAHDVTVALSIRVRNGRISRIKPETETYGPNSETEVARIVGSDPGKRWTWRCRFDWTKGSIHAKHDDDVVYRLPFKTGTSRRVIQGYDGRLTHHGRDRYAVDFAMREGTFVHAARGGVVVEVKESSETGGPRKSYKDHANFVSIAHEDGTIAEYCHLKHKGVLVEIG
jgi:murein DD-endopeptidase MepM/ murein hydrolase activator NlpD